VHIGFEKVKPLTRGGHGIFKLHAHKDRPAFLRIPDCGNHLGELHVRSEPNTWDLTVELQAAVPGSAAEDGGFRPTVLMARVSRYVEHNDGCSKRNVTDNVVGKNTALVRAIKCLADEGFIEVDETGKKHSLHHAKPFEADEGVASEIMGGLNGTVQP
jgi:hypothetical protein